MSEHTPGPWKVTQEICVVSLGELSKSGNKANIATCWPHTWLGEKDSVRRMKANARLIAAAPELLDTLQEVFNDLCQGAIPNADDSWWEKARAAIAKAKGESVSPVTSEGKSE